MALSGKAGEHMHQTYKQFKPMNRLPMTFNKTGPIDKVKALIKNQANSYGGQVRSTTNLLSWIDSNGNLEAIP